MKLKDHTGVLIKKAARLFERVANMNLDKLGVTHAQTTFLMRLWEKDGQTQMELTRSSGLKQPTVLKILERMQKDKLIKKIRNKNDKREFFLYLTEKAKSICTQLEPQGHLMQNISSASFKHEEIVRLNKKLLVIINNLKSFIDEHECENL